MNVCSVCILTEVCTVCSVHACICVLPAVLGMHTANACFVSSSVVPVVCMYMLYACTCCMHVHVVCMYMLFLYVDNCYMLMKVKVCLYKYVLHVRCYVLV